MFLKKHLPMGNIFWWMLLFIPVSLCFGMFTSYQTITFITSILAIIPLAKIIGCTTKEIAIQTNPTIGGLISATFGNIIELIIAIYALQHGLVRLVQASIVGSIVGNILLLPGLSIFAGGIKYKKQCFNKEVTGVSSTMLIIAVVGLTIPTMYAFAYKDGKGVAERLPFLSDAVAVVLALIYIGGLIFSLVTHRDLFDATDELKANLEQPIMSKRLAFLYLFLTTVIVAIESELMVKGVEQASLKLGFTHTFIGIVVIAIITNIAEKTSAVKYSLENKLDISLEIGMSSAIQIALFVVPILVFISQVCHFDFTLVFSMFEVIAIVLAVTIVNHLASDGICNWLEGAQLISVYSIIAIAFFFIE